MSAILSDALHAAVIGMPCARMYDKKRGSASPEADGVNVRSCVGPGKQGPGQQSAREV